MYINRNIQDFNIRLNEVIKRNKLLFKLRSNIEWIVNKLERCKNEDAPDDCDSPTNAEVEQLEDIIRNIRKELNTNINDQETSLYLDEITKYISSFENYLNETQKTLFSMGSQTFDNMKRSRQQNQVGGNQYGGVDVIRPYDGYNSSKAKYNEYLEEKKTAIGVSQQINFEGIPIELKKIIPT